MKLDIERRGRLVYRIYLIRQELKTWVEGNQKQTVEKFQRDFSQSMRVLCEHDDFQDANIHK